jgi:UDP-N-acetylmuramate--alanine ligase
MAGLARLLHQQGNRVRGTDRFANRQTHELQALGISITIGHARTHVPEDVGWAVRTPAIPAMNPEMELLRSRNIPVFARGEVLAAVANSRETLAVAGAHGKTTTSAMLLHILRTCGVRAGYAIGGETSYPGRVADAGDPEAPFVVEADESDGTLMQYRPQVGVITHIEWDHVERFPTEESLQACYQKFVDQTGALWIRDEDKAAVSISASHPKVCRAGRQPHCELQILEISSSLDGVRFRFRVDQECECRIPLPGEHNAWNAALAIGAAREVGVEPASAAASLASFAGVGRRFQKKEVRGITVIQDYAHHPTELRAVLESVQALRPGRIWMVFQPHRFSRTRHLLHEFAHALAGVDHLALIPVYAAFERPEQGAGSEELADACRKNHHQVKVWKERTALVQEWNERAKSGDVILIAGAGDVEELWKMFH